MKVYFTKGVDRRYPNRWYLSAHPEAQCVQYWSIKNVFEARDYIKSLGFKPAESYRTSPNKSSSEKIYDYIPHNERNLFIVFRNKSDEAFFAMTVSDGFEI